MVVSAIIICVLLILLIIFAVAFVASERKRKSSCIGCPYKNECENIDECEEDELEDYYDENEFF